MQKVKDGMVEIDKTSSFPAAATVNKLQPHLAEWFGFFKGYDPMFSWETLVGIVPGDEDAIVGQPIGLGGLLVDLEVEKIPYKPEELITIAETEYAWCEKKMKKYSRELGYGNDWRIALEHVKNLYAEPGEQPELIHHLADEAIDYVTKHDLVTVPPLAAATWRMFMMSPERQKANPFFLGGESILVSYPTNTMDHEAKMMTMRGNNIHFACSTAFHELIPVHTCNRPYRTLFDTPIWMERWSFYREMILWDKGFPKTPENRIRMLFWRMHCCARIIISLKFHLGEMSPRECIDLLVDMVGHERSTAEGEVRRSFNGDYTPLYQAGYMLGGLQIYSLPHELVQSGKVTEKEFHDRVLRENEMLIELLRALMKNQPVTPDFKASWRFYDLP